MESATISPQRFDNRSFPRTFRLRLRGSYGPLHFAWECGGRRIVYAYIRKNACSAFKNFIVSASDGGPREGESKMDWLLRTYRADYRRDIARADHTVFVHRDPVDRAVSTFTNFFVRRALDTDLVSEYARVTGCDPSDATFEDFVFRYLPHATDPHTRAQVDHLLPIVYSDSIAIESLQRGMALILGTEAAEKHFGRRANAAPRARHNAPSALVPSRKIRQAYESDRALPSRDGFLQSAGGLEERLREIYARDAAFFRT